MDNHVDAVMTQLSYDGASISCEGTTLSYALITALIFAIAAILHGWRIYKRWTVQIGPHSVSMTVSWVGLVVAALIAIWGFSQSG